jgi:uncharacterized MAPEG superfamily protein
MTLADLCLLGAVAIIIGTIAIAKAAGRGAFDNAKPRDPEFYKDPFRARALWAHQNGIETFPLFAAAVILAEMRGVRQPVVDGLALAFLAARIAFVAAYLADKPRLRSALFGLGFAVTLGIFFSPLWAKG